MDAGSLRHRVIIQELQNVADSSGSVQDEYGATNQDWITLAEVWASIEPVSVKEFVVAQSEQSKISTRIKMRYRGDVDYSMRIIHPAKKQYYNIEGVLADKASGLEYITLACSTGLRYINDPVPPPITHSSLYKDDGFSLLYKDDGTSVLYK